MRTRRCLGLGLLLAGYWINLAQAASYEVIDSFGKHRFEQPPTRVAVTDWTLLQALLSLGETPIAATETQAYREQVGALPDSVTDIGLRVAPDIATLRRLEPDLIIVGTGQKELARPLSRITRVMYYQQFSDRYRTNGTKSRQRFLQLAAVFQKTDQAQTMLAQRDAEISQLAATLDQCFEGQAPTVTLVQHIGQPELRLYGANSLPGHALGLLDLQPGLQLEPQQWGETRLEWSDLQRVDGGLILLFASPPRQAALQASEAWRTLVPTIGAEIVWGAALWPYGDAMAIGDLARHISQLVLQTHACPAATVN